MRTLFHRLILDVRILQRTVFTTQFDNENLEITPHFLSSVTSFFPPLWFMVGCQLNSTLNMIRVRQISTRKIHEIEYGHEN